MPFFFLPFLNYYSQLTVVDENVSSNMGIFLLCIGAPLKTLEAGPPEPVHGPAQSIFITVTEIRVFGDSCYEENKFKEKLIHADVPFPYFPSHINKSKITLPWRIPF